ncbi:MAG TPA: hypothetical protein VIM11_08715 [Tepidisphaeraceae bacterium]|jgi:hypothetical protein
MDNLEKIRTQLQLRHSNFFAKAYIQVMIGLAISMAAPAAVLIFVYALTWLWGKDLPLGWGTLGAIIVTLPWLFRFEIQAQDGLGGHIIQRFRAAEHEEKTPPSFAHLGVLGVALAQQRPPMTGLLEFFLIGPHLVVSALRKLRLRRLSENASIERIINVSDILCRLQGGAVTEKMLEPPETPAQLSEVLAYLLFFEWIGVANDGTKVWILTEGRRLLCIPAPAPS